MRPDNFTDQVNKKLQVAYFNDTMELYKRLNLPKFDKIFYTKEEFGVLLNITSNHFVFKCVNNGEYIK